ncbi:MAG: hypothetical protein U0359_24620 [Byssovorax sp.]
MSVCTPYSPPPTAFISYDSFRIDPEAGYIEYAYSRDDAERFLLRIRLDLSPARDPGVAAALAPAAFTLGLALISYVFVVYCPPEIRVRAAYLSDEQIDFWQSIFVGGLMEHFYVHQIPFQGLRIVADAAPSERVPLFALPVPDEKRVLVALGGGKDSALLVEMLREAGAQIAGSYYEDYPRETEALAVLAAFFEAARTEQLHIVSQDLVSDPELLAAARHDDVHDYTFYPIFYALSAVLVARMHGYRYIAVGNERSANFGNAEHQGHPVNHQYEKSFGFERRLSAYIERWLAPEVRYFSGLMHLWEIQIVERFVRYPQYFPVLLSCNQPRDRTWCRGCAKCAVTYLLLSAFLPPAEAAQILGGDLFADEALAVHFDAILGIAGDKPLECVCTREEGILAARLAGERYRDAGVALPPYLARAIEATRAEAIDAEALLHGYNEENLLPAWLRPTSS